MQELEQLKGKEINMLRFGGGSWGLRITFAQALIFIFNYETFSKTFIFLQSRIGIQDQKDVIDA